MILKCVFDYGHCVIDKTMVFIINVDVNKLNQIKHCVEKFIANNYIINEYLQLSFIVNCDSNKLNKIIEQYAIILDKLELKHKYYEYCLDNILITMYAYNNIAHFTKFIEMKIYSSTCDNNQFNMHQNNKHCIKTLDGVLDNLNYCFKYNLILNDLESIKDAINSSLRYINNNFS